MKKPLIFVCSSVVLLSFNPENVVAGEKNLLNSNTVEEVSSNTGEDSQKITDTNINKETKFKGEDISKLTDEELQYVPIGSRDGSYESEHAEEEKFQAPSVSIFSHYPDVNTYIQKMQPAKVEYQHKDFFPKFYYRNGKGAVEGVVAHETANNNSTIIQEISYMSRNYNNAFVHAFVDHERVIEIHPLDYGAWGAGRIANQRYVHVELVRANNFDEFARSINNYANYIADILYDYYLDVIDAEVSGKGTLWSHKAVSTHLGYTDHVDPHGYFASYGYSWQQFVNLVNSKYNKITRFRYLDTSKLGHINSGSVRIYKTLDNLDEYQTAGTVYTNEVYYIKKEASKHDQRYYLISREPSATNGIVGWVRSYDLTVKDHIWKDARSKTYYIKGTGKAYSKAWGGAKNIIFGDMKNFADQEFQVNLTETVGGETWYRGILNGETVWLHSEDVYPEPVVEVKSTSKLGHFNSDRGVIYKKIGVPISAISSSEYTDAVYYIKQETEYNGTTYYLISTNPSATSGVIGWVKASDMTVKNHIWKDARSKTYYIKGTGKAYSKAWGGAKNIVFGDMKNFADQEFQVNLTETVGGETWYRGILNGETVWLHNEDVYPEPVIEVKSTSKLGHFNSDRGVIYKKIGVPISTISSSEYTDAVYYIKQETEYNGTTYYLISTNPSATSGVIGWVKASDMTVKNHIWKDARSKTYYIKGTGKAYSKAWGGAKNIVFGDMKNFADQKFQVNLTETVGGETWYRGILNGETVWLHSEDVYPEPIVEVKSTSKLGHFNSDRGVIYKKIGVPTSTISSSEYADAVYYIKQEAEYNGTTYYLISTNPSATSGVIGWVKASEMTVKNHVWKDARSKIYYIKGTGKAYSKVWGGPKNIVYGDMTPYFGQEFQVNLTETVGGETWYRGILNGKLVWLHNSDISTKSIIEIKSTSKLGHFNSDRGVIYENLGDSTSTISSSGYTDAVYYIKQEAEYNGSTYYLISTAPSAISGVIGWVKAPEMTVKDHVWRDSKSKIFYITGTGKAYSKAWGGKKDLVYSDMTPYANQIFKVNLTEKVGRDTWYRGIFNGEMIWLHEKDVQQSIINYTHYNLNLHDAAKMQMKVLPQTDKYRNKPAYISSQYVDISQGGVISGSRVNVRTSAQLNNTENIFATLTNGEPFILLDSNIQGDLYNGSNRWYKIDYKGNVLYVHSSLATLNLKVGKTTTNVNLHSEKNSNSHIYKTISKGTLIRIVEEGESWHVVNPGNWRNATEEDVLYYLNPSNFINDEKQRFQFLDLSKPSGTTAETLNKYLQGKGILEGQGQAFIDASIINEISDIYLISHALLETGHGFSQLAQGIEYNGVVVYNMFGIGAVDSNPIEGGARTAFENGWTTPYKAIIGGAEFIGNNYIKAGQNTLYKMRWNPDAMEKYGYAFHQYASDIGWSSKQIDSLYNLYQDLGIRYLNLDIPVYKN